jgi:WD40 repeat protein
VADRLGNVWSIDATNPEQIMHRKYQLSAPITMSMLSPDSSGLATADQDGTVALWDLSNDKCLRSRKVPAGGEVVLAISSDSRRIAVAGVGPPVWVWNTADDSLRQVPCEGRVTDLIFAPDGRTLASNFKGDARPALCDVVSGRWIRPDELAHRGGVGALAFSNDSQTLATAGGDDGVTFWDCRSMKRLAQLSVHHQIVHSVTFSPDGRSLAVSDLDTVRILDVASRRETLALRGHSKHVGCIRFSPDGLTLASWAGRINEDAEVFFWSASAGKRPENRWRRQPDEILSQKNPDPR